jgi:predicted ester cyclase
LSGTIIAFTACNDDAAKTAGATDTDSNSKKEMSAEDKEERNKQTALASIAGINSHDVNAVMKDVAPGAKDFGDGSMPPASLDSSKAMLTQWFTAFPDVKGENLKAVADGEWVMVWGDWSGTWKGDFMGQKATGKSYKIKDVDIFRFNDEGKITEHHYTQNWITSASQIGMKMK